MKFELHHINSHFQSKIRNEVRRERAAVVSKKEPSVLRFTGKGGLNSVDPGKSKPKRLIR